MRIALARTAREHVKGWLAVAVAVSAVLVLTVIGVSAYGQTRSTPEAQAAPAATAKRPNIVFVLTDDLTPDLVRYMPHVRQMQRNGVNFDNFFVVDSLCCPSRAAILTGLYPHNNGVFRNNGADGGFDGFNAHGNVRKTYGLALQRAGYRTGFMGKYLNHYEPEFGVPSGWNEWDVASPAYHEYNYRLNENGTVHHYGHAPRDYVTTVLSGKATSFITRSASSQQPFALEIAPFTPHQPAVPAPRDAHTFNTVTAPRGPAWDSLPTHAPRWLADFPKLDAGSKHDIDLLYRQRVRSVQSVDRMIGHLQGVLQHLGVADNTYLVFSSDNGFHLGEHRLRPGKQTAFDTDTRVPLVVTGPGVPVGRSVAAVTASIDLAPTFEQIARARPKYATDGISMLDLWHGHPAPTSWPGAVLVEHRGRPFLPGDPDVQPNLAGNPPSYEAIRTADALYVEYADGSAEYYDLRTDPDELHDIAATVSPSILRPLRNALHRLEHCRGPDRCS
jgi:N-acetylglucosamine-6-sulfatase